MKWLSGWAVLGCVCVMGCGGGLSPDEGKPNDEGQATDSNAKDLSSPTSTGDNDYNTTASGRELMRATSSQLKIFQNACLDGELLKYDCGNSYDGGSLSAKHKAKIPDNHTRVSDNGGGYAGECVSFVRVESNKDLGWGYWHKGDKVVDGGTPAGAVISLFAGDKYNGHVAFFLSYDKDSKGHVTGIYVIDQNWGGSGVVRKHHFSRGGNGQADADNYYEVEVDK